MAGDSPWGHKESDTAEQLTLSTCYGKTHNELFGQPNTLLQKTLLYMFHFEGYHASDRAKQISVALSVSDLSLL